MKNFYQTEQANGILIKAPCASRITTMLDIAGSYYHDSIE